MNPSDRCYLPASSGGRRILQYLVLCHLPVRRQFKRTKGKYSGFGESLCNPVLFKASQNPRHSRLV